MSLSLFGIFGAGLLTFLSPCVLPLVPVFTASLSVSGQSGKFGRLVSTLWFVTGFTLVFVLFGLSLPAVISVLGPLKPLLIGISGVVLILYGLKMSETIDLGKYLPWMNSTLQAKLPKSVNINGMQGLLFGALFGLSWTPCVGPLLGGVLTYVASQESSSVRSALMLFVFAMGIASPLLAVALMFDRLAPLLKGLRSKLPMIEKTTGFALILFGVFVLGQARFQKSSAETLGATDSVSVNSPSGSAVVLDGASLGHARMVFFYSTHCPICHAMESFMPAFEQSCSSSAFDVVRVNVDDQSNQAAAAKYGVHAVPTLSLLNETGREIIHLVGYQTESRLRDAAKTLTGLVCAEKLKTGHDILPAPKLIEENTVCTVGEKC
ncbi:MAG: conjugal transfer protein TraF [Bdellovibrionales bacterium]|nr:conjugal transfer protein TraF [Oligoflexia bacterium]